MLLGLITLAWGVDATLWQRHLLGIAVGACAAEAVWLVLAPVIPSYQALQGRRRLAELRRAKDREVKRLVDSLTPELAQRFHAAKRLEQDIRAAASESGAVASDLLAEELEKLEALLSAFLRLLMASLRYRQYLIRTDETAILKDLAHLEGKLERTADTGTKRIIQQNLDILHKRQERFGAIQRGYFHVQAQLEVIEDTFRLVSDQMVSLRAPDTLKIDLGQIISGVETTEAVLLETNALIAQHT